MMGAHVKETLMTYEKTSLTSKAVYSVQDTLGIDIINIFLRKFFNSVKRA